MAHESRPLYWLPALLGLGALIATLLLWQALTAQERIQIERMIQLITVAVKQDIADSMDSRILALVRMAKRWEIRGQPPQNEWISDAGHYVRHYSGYQAIGWVDPKYRLRWIASPNEGESEFITKARIGSLQLQTLAAARDANTVKMTHSIDLPYGGKAFQVYVPIFSYDIFSGYIAGIFRSQELLEAILLDQVKLGEYGIAVFEGEALIYQSEVGELPRSQPWTLETDIELYGVSWRVRVWPKPGHLATVQSRLPQATLVMGGIMALMLFLAAHFALTAWRRERALKAANLNLQREVAERKRAEEADARHTAELKRSNTELRQFAYVTSHDLQEPLRIVSSYVQLLAKRYRGHLDADADEYIRYTVDGVARMQNLINDLLAYSRVGSQGKVFALVDFEEVLSGTLNDLKAAIDDSGAVITHDPLPTLIADPSQMSQLFMNLIGNAIKYRGSNTPQIHIGAAQQSDEWLFAVRDNGIGIDPKYAERIFVIFQRLHGKDEYSGTGIGLAICKKVVENHGGRIWVESTPGQGATFYFTLPVRESA